MLQALKCSAPVAVTHLQPGHAQTAQLWHEEQSSSTLIRSNVSASHGWKIEFLVKYKSLLTLLKLLRRRQQYSTVALCQNQFHFMF